jgi:hypothetical protein
MNKIGTPTYVSQKQRGRERKREKSNKRIVYTQTDRLVYNKTLVSLDA